jgi:hypothetical protein
MTPTDSIAVEREVRVSARPETIFPFLTDSALIVLAYTGGTMPETEEARNAQMAAWGQWFQELGGAIVDGGKPVGASKLISDGGAVSDGAPSGLTGYSVIAADSLDAATELAKGCPVFTVGGSVEVYETFEVM